MEALNQHIFLDPVLSNDPSLAHLLDTLDQNKIPIDELAAYDYGVAWPNGAPLRGIHCKGDMELIFVATGEDAYMFVDPSNTLRPSSDLSARDVLQLCLDVRDNPSRVPRYRWWELWLYRVIYWLGNTFGL